LSACPSRWAHEDGDGDTAAEENYPNPPPAGTRFSSRRVFFSLACWRAGWLAGYSMGSGCGAGVELGMGAPGCQLGCKRRTEKREDSPREAGPPSSSGYRTLVKQGLRAKWPLLSCARKGSERITCAIQCVEMCEVGGFSEMGSPLIIAHMRAEERPLFTRFPSAGSSDGGEEKTSFSPAPRTDGEMKAEERERNRTKRRGFLAMETDFGRYARPFLFS